MIHDDTQMSRDRVIKNVISNQKSYLDLEKVMRKNPHFLTRSFGPAIISELLHYVSVKQMILKEEPLLFKRLQKFPKLVLSPVMLTWRTETSSILCISYRKFLCQSHLYMSFPYFKCLFHRNNLILDLYYPEKYFHLKIWMD